MYEIPFYTNPILPGSSCSMRSNWSHKKSLPIGFVLYYFYVELVANYIATGAKTSTRKLILNSEFYLSNQVKIGCHLAALMANFELPLRGNKIVAICDVYFIARGLFYCSGSCVPMSIIVFFFLHISDAPNAHHGERPLPLRSGSTLSAFTEPVESRITCSAHASSARCFSSAQSCR